MNEEPSSRFRLTSVRGKIMALVGFVVIATTLLDAWLVPSRAEEAERNALRERASATAAMLADATQAAVEFEQEDGAREGLNTALADPLVQWAAIYHRNGQLMTKVGSGVNPPRTLRTRSNVHILGAEDGVRGQVEAAAAPIVGPSGSLGTVAVGLRSNLVEERRDQARTTITIQGALIAAVGLLLAFILSGRIAKSVTEIRRAAERISRGDVEKDIGLTYTADELGDMAQSFQRMNDRLRELSQVAARVAAGDLTGKITGDGELYIAFRRMVESLRELTERIGSSSEAVSGAAAGMFSAVREQQTLATQQTAALEEIRKTLESLANAAETVAEDARSVREMSGRTLESSQRMAEQTRLVSAHSDRIGEILSLIQDIADRSDLLALNAALEGTKAGEVGRGFSLVAAEMRRLSEHVMDSVRDIRKLVADMRAASHSSVLATEESTKLAKDAASAAIKISDAVRRQQEGTSQAKLAADEVVRAVNESLSGVEDTTRSAESLLELSHELKNTLKAFKVRAEQRE
jgi:methyl-accepting chemotaxis protein